MRATHLATRGVTACNSIASWPMRSRDLTDVTCQRCLGYIARARAEIQRRDKEAADRAAERKAAYSVGLGAAYDHCAAEDNPSKRVARLLVWTLALYLQESGYIVADDAAFSALAGRSP